MRTFLTRILLALGVILAAAAGVGIWLYQNQGADAPANLIPQQDYDPELAVPAAQPVSPTDIARQPSQSAALPGNVLIADRGNNRLIEVTPDKQIVWSYDFNTAFPNLKPGQGSDDSFFTPSGQTIIVNLEEYHLVAEIDYQTKQIVWQYGHPGQAGSAPGYLNTPDDAYRWPDGLTSVADIKNCRVIFVDQAGQIKKQFGHKGKCENRPGYYNDPNGDTPLPNGNTLISLFGAPQIIEVTPDGTELLRLTVPVGRPSDAQKLKNGNYLVADYSKPGKIIEVTPSGRVVWQYEYPGDPEAGLDHPSLAEQLPDGNIIATDDGNHRIVVIDYQTQQIIWQYGVTGRPGNAPGQLNIPDGLDIHYPPGAKP